MPSDCIRQAAQEHEYTPPTWEGHFPDGYSNFNPNLANPAAGGILGASEFAGEGPGRTGEKSMYKAWPWGLSPRLGVVYSLNPNTVVRRRFPRVRHSTGIRAGRRGPSRRSWCPRR